MTDDALGSYLRARRSRVTPEDVGLQAGPHRRVKGLRREELATLAGISVSYYVRLEQGHDRHPTPLVVAALADALRLDAEARRHLEALAGPASPARRVAPAVERVRPELARLLDRQVDAPALVLGAFLDVLAANRLATTLLPTYAPGRNVARDAFLDDATRSALPELREVQRTTLGSLRDASLRVADDPRLHDLVDELSTASDEFRTLWSRHEAHRKRAGAKAFLHPAVGRLDLDYEAFAIEADPLQRLVVFHADPATPAGRRLALLRTLAADSVAAGILRT